MQQNVTYDRGSGQTPLGELTSASPDPLAGFRGAASRRVGGGGGRREGRGREAGEGKERRMAGRERKGRG